MPITPATSRRPWPSDTIGLPNKIEKRTVVAQLKVPSPRHQWVVVLECDGEVFVVASVVYDPHTNAQRPFRVYGESVTVDNYDEAVSRMLRRRGNIQLTGVNLAGWSTPENQP